MNIAAPIKERRRLWKYIAAISAFQEAEEGVSYIATQIGTGASNDSLVNCLWTGVVSSYCRPFTHNNDVGPIDINLVPEGKKRKLHDALWSMRNKLCGHVDHEAKLDRGYPVLPVAVEMINGELCSHCPGARPDISIAPDILTLITYMKGACTKKWPQILKKISPTEDLPNGKLRINLSKENDEVFLYD